MYALLFTWPGLSSQETWILAPAPPHGCCVIFLDLSFLLHRRVLLLVVTGY